MIVTAIEVEEIRQQTFADRSRLLADPQKRVIVILLRADAFKIFNFINC